jgi:hypothetical protein
LWCSSTVASFMYLLAPVVQLQLCCSSECQSAKSLLELFRQPRALRCHPSILQTPAPSGCAVCASNHP